MRVVQTENSVVFHFPGLKIETTKENFKKDCALYLKCLGFTSLHRSSIEEIIEDLTDGYEPVDALNKLRTVFKF